MFGDAVEQKDLPGDKLRVLCLEVFMPTCHRLLRNRIFGRICLKAHPYFLELYCTAYIE